MMLRSAPVCENFEQSMSIFTLADTGFHTNKKVIEMVGRLKQLTSRLNDAEKVSQALLLFLKLKHLYSVQGIPLKMKGDFSWEDEVKNADGTTSTVTITEKSSERKKLEALRDDIEQSGLTITDTASETKINITDDFIACLHSKLEDLLGEEKNEAAKAALETFVEVDGMAKIEMLQTTIRAHIQSIDIQLIKQGVFEANCAKSPVAGEDVIVMLGDTGAGKSTAMHVMCGSTFTLQKIGSGSTVVERLDATRFAPAVAEFKIGRTAISETKRFGSLNLNDPALKQYMKSTGKVDYKLEAPLFLCDTPGLKDTEKTEADVVNMVTIVNPLRTAKSVRFLVLIPHTSLASRGEALKKLLDNITKMIPNVDKLKGAIYYCFTGDVRDNFFDTVNETIDLILAPGSTDSVGVSDAVKSLLRDMKEKINAKGVKPVINPLGKIKITPQDLMKKLMALTPIENPESEIIPNIETENRQALENQLRTLFARFDARFEQFMACIQENKLNEIKPLMDSASEQLELIQFVHEFLGDVDREDFYGRSALLLRAMATGICLKVEKMLPANQPEKIVTQADLDNYNKLTQVHSAIRVLWSHFYQDVSVSKEADSEIPESMKPDALATVAQRFFAECKERAREYQSFQRTLVEKSHLEQIKLFVDSLGDKPEESAMRGFPVVRLQRGDECVRGRLELIENLTPGYKVLIESDGISWADRFDDKISKSKVICGFSGGDRALDSLTANLDVCELFGLSADGYSSSTMYRELIAGLKTQFGISQTLHDFHTAVYILDRLETIFKKAGTANSEQQLNELKTALIEQLNSLVPAFVNDLSKTEVRDFTKLETEQLIYAQKIIVSLAETDLVKKHLQAFKTTGENPTGLITIYSKTSTKINAYFSLLTKRLTDALANENDLGAFAVIDKNVTLLWDVMSIPTTKARKAQNEKEFNELRQKIRSFAIGFRQRFGVMLASENAITAEQCKLMGDYYTSLFGRYWVTEFDLQNETFVALLNDVSARINAKSDAIRSNLAGIVSRSDVKLKEACDLLLELKLFSSALPETMYNALAIDADDLFLSLTVTLDSTLEKIYKDCSDKDKFDAISMDEIGKIYSFISQCYEILKNNMIPPLTSTVSDNYNLAHDAFISAYMRKTRAMLDNFHEHMDLLAEWQEVSGELRPTVEQMHIMTRGVIATYHQYRTLLDAISQSRTDMARLVSAGKSILDSMQSTLVKNVESFSKELRSALNARFSNIDGSTQAEERHLQLLSLCENLFPLDDLLPEVTVDTGKLASYKELHRKFNKSISDELVDKFRGILADVRKGAYTKAINDAAELIVDNGPREKLSFQVNSIVQEQVETIVKKCTMLNGSTATSPGFLPDLDKAVVMLEQALELAPVGLISDETVQSINDVVASYQSILSNWFMRVLSLIFERLKTCEFNRAIELISELRVAISVLTRKPENAEEIDNIVKNIEDRMQQLPSTYLNDVSEWDDYFTLNQLFHGLNEIYPQTWQEISENVIQSVDRFCQGVEAGHGLTAEGGVANIVNQISQIEWHIQGLPEEGTNLFIQVQDRIQDCLSKIVLKLLDPAETNVNLKLARICELMEARSRLGSSASKLDIKEIMKPVEARVKELVKKIIATFAKGEFPTQELGEYFEIFERASRFINLRAGFDMVKKHLTGFITPAFNKLQESTAKYSKNQSEALSDIVEACERLRCVQASRLRLTDENRALFDEHMLEQRYFASVNTYFGNFLNVFKRENNLFEANLSECNVPKLKARFKFLHDWEAVIKVISMYLSSEPNLVYPMTDLKELLKSYHAQRFSQLVADKFQEMATASVITFDGFRMLLEKSEAARKAYYEQLSKAVSVLGEAGSVVDINDRAFPNQTEFLEMSESLVASVEKFLQKIYVQAVDELATELEDKEAWDNFGSYYKELQLFALICSSSPQLNTIKVSDDLMAVDAAEKIRAQFDEKLSRYVTETIQVIGLSKTIRSPEEETEMLARIVNLIIALQKIISSLPGMSNRAKDLLTKFLQLIRENRNNAYLQVISDELQKDPHYGPMVIDQQKCFEGLAISLRKAATSAQDIEYVLNNLTERVGNGEIRPISEEEKTFLRSAYTAFRDAYNEIITEKLKPETDFKNHGEAQFKALFEALEVLLSQPCIVFDKADKAAYWDASAKVIIPVIAAYVFAIWTLRDSRAAFEMDETDDRAASLKEPHAGQIVSIFRMVNLNGNELKADRKIPKNLAQVLTGEGKSIVNGVVVAMLSLLCMSANASCYSEYLSGRDFKDLEGIFDFLKAKEKISYQTLNRLLENILNERVSLRDLTRDLIDGKNTVSISRDVSDMPRALVVDEVDVFFNRDFYGALYNPLLTYANAEVLALIDAIWVGHRRGQELTVDSVKSSQEYMVCVNKMGKWSFLLEKAVPEMLDALRVYKNHEYRVVNGRVAYTYQDGESSDIFKGYKTMWAYFEKHYAGNEVTKEVMLEFAGIIVNIGSFSYIDVLRDMGLFSITTGVTGTLQELSEPERRIVREEFEVNLQTFVPSAYGENKLKFPKKSDVKVVKAAEFFNTMMGEIRLRRVGQANTDLKDIRPGLIFFSSIERLNEFYQEIMKLDEFRGKVNLMTKTSSSSPEEIQAEIDRAVRAGMVTLIDPEVARGRDTICRNTLINANGGVFILDSDFSLQLSMERQKQGRAARQGAPGTYGMLLIEEDLIERFSITASDIERMRKENSIYDSLNDIRVKKFAEIYQKLSAEMAQVREVLHKPSVALWQLYQQYEPGQDIEPIVNLLKLLNPMPVASHAHKSSRTLVLIDATGSMSSSISAVRSCVSSVMSNLSIALAAADLAKDDVAVQIAVYRNYGQILGGEFPIFQSSPWTSRPGELQTFIDRIVAKGGYSHRGNEAVEVGFCHALEQKGLTQVILIGDIGPNTVSELAESKAESTYNAYHKNTFYGQFRDAMTLAKELKTKGIPVFPLYVSSYARYDFNEIADASGGTAEPLDVYNVAAASQKLYSIFGNRVIRDIAGTDESLRDKLMKKYTELQHTQRR